MDDPDPPEPQDPTSEQPTGAELYFMLSIPVEPDGSLDLSDMTLEELLAHAKAYNDEIKRRRSAS
jgi:hypothetical protein